MSYLEYLRIDALNYIKSKQFIFSLLGLILLLAIWELASLTMNEIMVSSPLNALSALFEMFSRERFWDALFITARRMTLSIFIGGVVGFVLGLIAGLNENIKNLLEPTRWMIMSISPVIVVSMAMMWFGMGSHMVVFIAALLLSPIVYVNTIKGVEMVDDKILEMAHVYNFSFFQKLRHIYIPALVGPLSAAMTIVVTAGMRMIVLAEVLGANSGIGYEFSFSNTEMNTPEIFAWTVVTLSLVGIAEYLCFKPLENYLLRWKRA